MSFFPIFYSIWRFTDRHFHIQHLELIILCTPRHSNLLDSNSEPTLSYLWLQNNLLSYLWFSPLDISFLMFWLKNDPKSSYGDFNQVFEISPLNIGKEQVSVDLLYFLTKTITTYSRQVKKLQTDKISILLYKIIASPYISRASKNDFLGAKIILQNSEKTFFFYLN